MLIFIGLQSVINNGLLLQWVFDNWDTTMPGQSSKEYIRSLPVSYTNVQYAVSFSCSSTFPYSISQRILTQFKTGVYNPKTNQFTGGISMSWITIGY